MNYKPGDKLIFIDESTYGGKKKAYFGKIAKVVRVDEYFIYVWFPEIGNINEYFGDAKFTNWNTPEIGGGFRPEQFERYTKLGQALK